MFNFQEREVKTGGGARMKMKRRKENWSSKKTVRVSG